MEEAFACCTTAPQSHDGLKMLLVLWFLQQGCFKQDKGLTPNHGLGHHHLATHRPGGKAAR